MDFITIKGEQFAVKDSLIALLQYQKISGKKYGELDLNNIEDILILMYAQTKAGEITLGKDFPYTFEQFCILLDQTPSAMTEFKDIIISRIQKAVPNMEVTPQKKQPKTRKKKNRLKNRLKKSSQSS